MEIIHETQTAISKKIAQLQSKEQAWREKQGGNLVDWQEYQLKQGVTDIQRLQSLLSYVETLTAEQSAKPLTRREEILIKHGYTEKDILLRKLVHLIDTVIDRKTPQSPLSITVEKRFFLNTLREISERYKTLNHG